MFGLWRDRDSRVEKRADGSENIVQCLWAGTHEVAEKEEEGRGESEIGGREGEGSGDGGVRGGGGELWQWLSKCVTKCFPSLMRIGKNSLVRRDGHYEKRQRKVYRCEHLLKKWTWRI